MRPYLSAQAIKVLLPPREQEYLFDLQQTILECYETNVINPKLLWSAYESVATDAFILREFLDIIDFALNSEEVDEETLKGAVRDMKRELKGGK